MSTFTRLTDRQWRSLEPILTRDRRSGRGRPRIHDDRAALDGVLWILRTGAQWRALPSEYPSYPTCCRRFRKWADSGLLKEILLALEREIGADGRLGLDECYVDGTFVPAKRGAPPSDAAGREGGARSS